MEQLAQLVHALVSPVNCVGGLGHDLLVSFGNFFQCVGGNLGAIAQQGGSAINTVATASGDAIVSTANVITTTISPVA